MGMYDSVWVPCPRCKAPVEVQSKDGPCLLNHYTLADAPLSVLDDICDGTVYLCGRCRLSFTLSKSTESERVRKLRWGVIRSTEIAVDIEKCEDSSQYQFSSEEIPCSSCKHNYKKEDSRCDECVMSQLHKYDWNYEGLI